MIEGTVSPMNRPRKERSYNTDLETILRGLVSPANRRRKSRSTDTLGGVALPRLAVRLEEAADALKCSIPTVYRLLRDRKIAHTRVGASVRILYWDVLRYVNEQSSGMQHGPLQTDSDFLGPLTATGVPPIVDIERAAELLAVKPWTIYRLIQSGELTPVEASGSTRIELEELLKYLMRYRQTDLKRKRIGQRPIRELCLLLLLRAAEEKDREQGSRLGSESSSVCVAEPFRWRDWAVPTEKSFETLLASTPALPFRDYWAVPAKESFKTLGQREMLSSFVNERLLGYLKSIGGIPGATISQKILSQFAVATGEVSLNESRLAELIEAVSKLDVTEIPAAFDELIRRMGEDSRGGGDLFTQRTLVKVLVELTNPKIGETVYDPCCGTGGFLLQSYNHIRSVLGHQLTIEQEKTLSRSTFFGRERAEAVYSLALANLFVHGVREPHIWFGNTLTGVKDYGSVVDELPGSFDVVLLNPPIGHVKMEPDPLSRYEFASSRLQTLFLQHAVKNLKTAGRCGMVLTKEIMTGSEKDSIDARRFLLDKCDIQCLVAVPSSGFVNTNLAKKDEPMFLVFFTKGTATQDTWFYDLSYAEASKKRPLTRDHFDTFFRLLPSRGRSERSRSVSRDEIERGEFPVHRPTASSRTGSADASPVDQLLDLFR